VASGCRSTLTATARPSLPHGTGRDRVETAPSTISVRTLTGLDQRQEPGRAGADAHLEVTTHMSQDDPGRQRFERYAGPPMRLGNTRAQGVRTLDACCSARECHHYSTVDVKGLANETRCLRPARCGLGLTDVQGKTIVCAAPSAVRGVSG